MEVKREMGRRRRGGRNKNESEEQTRGQEKDQTRSQMTRNSEKIRKEEPQKVVELIQRRSSRDLAVCSFCFLLLLLLKLLILFSYNQSE